MPFAVVRRTWVDDLAAAIEQAATATKWPMVYFANVVLVEGSRCHVILPWSDEPLLAAVDGGVLHGALRKTAGDVTLTATGAELEVTSDNGIEPVPAGSLGAGSEAFDEAVHVTATVPLAALEAGLRGATSDRVVLTGGPGGRGVELWDGDRPLYASLTGDGRFDATVPVPADLLRQVAQAVRGASVGVGALSYGVVVTDERLTWVLVDPARTPWRDPLREIRTIMWSRRHSCHLGHFGECRFSDRQSAVLVLGVPRSGKTTSVLVPNIMAWPGPVLTTSSKTEIIEQTATARSRGGRLWLFDPTGDAQLPPRVRLGYWEHATPPITRLRWSPVVGSESWREAQMVAGEIARSSALANKDAHDQPHFVERAAQLIAVLLHAAAIDGRAMRGVLRWMFRRDLDEPRSILEARLAETNKGELAIGQLEGLTRTPETELLSIWSTADRMLAVYNTDEALDSADEPNFDMRAFAHSSDTVYLGGTTRDQAHAAAIIVGFLTALREAIYKEQLTEQDRSVLWALDEMANICPIPDLSSIVSQAGGQQLIIMGAIQDLSQARKVWDKEADGFFSLFGAKLILRGIADNDTLRRLSELAGKEEVEVQTVSTGAMGNTVSTHKELRDRLPIERIAAGPLEGPQADGVFGSWIMEGSRIGPCVLQPFYHSFDGHGWALVAAGVEFHSQLDRLLQTLRIDATRAVEAAIEDVLSDRKLSRDMWWAVWLALTAGGVTAEDYARVGGVNARTADQHLEQLAKRAVLRWLPDHQRYWGGPALVDALDRHWDTTRSRFPKLHGMGDLANQAIERLTGQAEQLVAPTAVRDVVAQRLLVSLCLTGRCETWSPLTPTA